MRVLCAVEWKCWVRRATVLKAWLAELTSFASLTSILFARTLTRCVEPLLSSDCQYAPLDGTSSDTELWPAAADDGTSSDTQLWPAAADDGTSSDTELWPAAADDALIFNSPSGAGPKASAGDAASPLFFCNRASSALLCDLLDAPTALAACCGFDLCHKYIWYWYWYWNRHVAN